MGHLRAPDPSIGTVTPLLDTSSAGTQNAGSSWVLSGWRGHVGRHYAWWRALCRRGRSVQELSLRVSSAADPNTKVV